MAEKQCNLLKNGGGMSKYSTSETFTGNYWIDGKPIYRKVFEFTIPNQSTQINTTISHGISDIDTVTNVRGVVTNTSGADAGYGHLMSNTYDGNPTGWGACLSWTKTIIRFQCGADYASNHKNQPSYIVFEYTKS